MKFSARTAWDHRDSALTRAVNATRAERPGELTDLTLSNPTRCGFSYDETAILGALNVPLAMDYDPDPMGIQSARVAVAAYYQDHGASVGAKQVLLTTSTSEAYSFLFRLLCDAGDAVCAAQPSYPLFDFIADLDDVTLIAYPLFEDYGWWIDFAELERRITERTRAILLVHPNNPTGHAVTSAERLRLEALCCQRGIALIVDEVFLDYKLTAAQIQSFACGPHPCLTFVISGLSKIAALPQMKVGWLAAFGPEPARSEALSRLEVIADTFLSMNSPAQQALPTWLALRRPMQEQIVERVRGNLLRLEQQFDVIAVEAGWSAIVRLRRDQVGGLGGEELAAALVEQAGLLVHPGVFFGLTATNQIVVSLIVPVGEFAAGCGKLKQWCEANELTADSDG